jgi:hypothetical protein
LKIHKFLGLLMLMVAPTLNACGGAVSGSPTAAPVAQATAAPTTAPTVQPTAAPVATAAPRATQAAPAATQPAQSEPVVVSGAGATPDELRAKVDEYRQLLGLPDNVGTPATQPSGHREINWDGVPDEFAAPNALPSDFFNADKAPRARGAVLATPGTSVQVSADSDNSAGTPPRFGDINDSYSNIFTAFSGERMFSPVGSNIVDLTFFVPGTKTPAVVRGFGAVYADVDTDHTAFEYFDAADKSLGKFATPIANNGLSFLGVVFPEPVVHRVRIAYGTAALGPNDGTANDVAVMDDFIYGEPQALP